MKGRGNRGSEDMSVVGMQMAGEEVAGDGTDDGVGAHRGSVVDGEGYGFYNRTNLELNADLDAYKAATRGKVT